MLFFFERTSWIVREGRGKFFIFKGIVKYEWNLNTMNQ